MRNSKWMMALLTAGTLTMAASAQMQEGPMSTTATVSVETKQTVDLDPSKLKVQVNGHDVPLTSVQPVTAPQLQIAVLIDDGLRDSFGLQLNDMKKFIGELPAGAQLLIGYMQNGRVISRGFTTNREQSMGELRLPESLPGISASPYFCLSDFVKHWPAQQPGTRVVLLLTNGVDPYNGSISPLNQDSPYVQAAAEDAARAGVTVYAIPYHQAGLPGGLGSFSGQSYLQQVAEETGGRLLYQGSLNPVTITPYLNTMLADLRESYSVTFPVDATHVKESTLDRLKISTTQSGIKLHSPEAVHPGDHAAGER